MKKIFLTLALTAIVTSASAAKRLDGTNDDDTGSLTWLCSTIEGGIAAYISLPERGAATVEWQGELYLATAEVVEESPEDITWRFNFDN